MYCPGWNATDPIGRVLASSDGISSWTPLKSLHCNPNPNPNTLANQLWSIDFLTPYHTSHHPSQTPCLPWISYATEKLMLGLCKMVENQSEAFHTFLWHFSKFKTILLHFVLLKCQIAFLKFTGCDNQALIRCILIAAVAVDLNLKSQKLVSHLIRCITITYFIFKSLRQF